MNEHIITMEVKRGFEAIAPLWDIVQGKGFIGGSYAAYMAGGFDFKPGDVDIFATSDENADQLFALCYNHFNMGYTSQSSIARGLTPHPSSPIKMPLQVIKPNPAWVNFPDDVIECFDMDVCRAVLISPTELMCDENVGLGKAKFLRINDPFRSLKRAMKYHQRGFEFNDWELLKLLQAWDQVDPDKKAQLLEATRTHILGNEYAIDEEDNDDYDDDGEYWGGYNVHQDDYFDGE